MVNAFCVILSQICKKYIVACPELDSYVSNREEVFDALTEQFELSNIPADRKTLKKCFLIPLHHGCYKRQITDGVEIDLERSEAISNQQVTGHGPSGRVRAEGMEIRNKGGVIFLKGKSTIVMSPEGAGN